MGRMSVVGPVTFASVTPSTTMFPVPNTKNVLAGWLVVGFTSTLPRVIVKFGAGSVGEKLPARPHRSPVTLDLHRISTRRTPLPNVNNPVWKVHD